MTEFSTIAFHSSHYIVFPWLVSVYTKAPSKLIKFPLKPHKISPVDAYCPQDVSYVHLVLIDLPLLNLDLHFPPVLWRWLPSYLAQGALPFVLQWIQISAPWDWAGDSQLIGDWAQWLLLLVSWSPGICSSSGKWLAFMKAHSKLSSLPSLLPGVIARNPSRSACWTAQGLDVRDDRDVEDVLAKVKGISQEPRNNPK